MRYEIRRKQVRHSSNEIHTTHVLDSNNRYCRWLLSNNLDVVQGDLHKTKIVKKSLEVQSPSFFYNTQYIEKLRIPHR